MTDPIAQAGGKQFMVDGTGARPHGHGRKKSLPSRSSSLRTTRHSSPARRTSSTAAGRRARRMQIELVEVTPAHAPVLDALLELYQYDFTEFTDEDVGDDGRFGNDMVDAVLRQRSGALRIPAAHRRQVGGADAAASRRVPRRRTRVHGHRRVLRDAEVSAQRRRRSAGAALSSIASRAAGKYARSRTTCRRRRSGAAIIGRYTGGRFEERTWDDEKWRGPVQFFDSRERV